MPVWAAIGLGSNVGDRGAHLLSAVAALQSEVGELIGLSPVYETAPVGGREQGAFLNAVAVVATELDGRQVLAALLGIERGRGRERRERWGPRTLDLDLLIFADQIIEEPGLSVPHPQLAERRFVLEPLLAAWPSVTLPNGTPVAALLPTVSDQQVQQVRLPGWPPPQAALYRGGSATRRRDVAGDVIVIDHPLVQHKLTLMRRQETSTAEFRRLLREISVLMGYELTRDLPLEYVGIETPLAPMQAPIVAGLKPVIVSILRAGGGILEGILDVIPSARVGHIGLYRDHATLEAVQYYFKMPEKLAERIVIVVDPMLATGHSAVAAVDLIKQRDPQEVRFVCLVAAPEGITHFHGHHPDVTVWTAAIDSRLNEHGYIVPGLGDAGDRIFGTK